MIKATLELWRRYMSLFEWQDGPLVEAMKCGDVFILDEINLAEDAVIERLNSVLENSRTLTLAERGSQKEDGEDDSNVVVVAHPNFRFLATMNPVMIMENENSVPLCVHVSVKCGFRM